MPFKLEIVANENNDTGEGPIWDSRKNRLIWVDIDNALVYQLSAGDIETTIISRELSVSSIALNSDGGLVFAGKNGLFIWYDKDNYKPIAIEHDSELLSFNDMITGPQGRIYAGTIYWGPNGIEKTGKLYLIDTNCSVHILDENVELSNGLAFSPDDSTLYYTDSAKRCIYGYDVDKKTGDLRNKRILIEVPHNEGIPDGLTVDADGNLWSAHWYGGQIVQYSRNGKVKQRISMPVKQVSSVMFGGTKLNELYITTASKYWHSNLVPPDFDSTAQMGGQLYRLILGIQGKPEHFAELNT